MKSFEYAVSSDVATLVQEVKALAARAQSMWKFDLARLEGAKIELHTYLELFCSDLDKHPVFAKMPPLPTSFEYVWATFLMDGEPGTQKYDEAWGKESAMSGLGLSDVFIVQTANDTEDALWMLLHHERAQGQNAEEDAASYLRTATNCIESAKKSIALVEALAAPATATKTD